MAQKLTFTAWMQGVDRVLSATMGLTHQDLPDCCYLDWYDNGCPATVAAARAKRMAKADGGF